jgi:hypothetical protein
MSVGPNNPNTTTQFIDGYATTATAAGTTTLTVASAGQQYFTGTTTQTVVLPVTSTLVLGQTYRVVNNSTGAVTVQSSGANEVAVVSPGTAATFTVILTSGTSAASWDFKFGSTLTLGAVVATTSGTSIDFTGIPAWVKRITVNYSLVSTNGSNGLIVQLGTSGGIVSTLYECQFVEAVAGAAGAGTSTTGFYCVNMNSSSGVASGSVVLSLLSPAAFTWVMTGNGSNTNSARAYSASGGRSLAAVLDRVRLTTVGSTNTFDAGSVNVSYEG